MIDVYQTVVLALLQGLTEFLPLTSAAHLLFPSLLLGWPDQDIAFDVAMHVGTLSALLLYYRDNMVRIANPRLRSFAGAPACDDSRMISYLALVLGLYLLILIRGIPSVETAPGRPLRRRYPGTPLALCAGRLIGSWSSN